MQTSWVDLLHWTLSCLLLSPESGVDCPCPWFHANSLCCPAANCSRPGPPSTASLLSSANCSLPGPPSTTSLLSSANCSQLLCPANSHSRPLPTSGKAEISCPRILCLVSRQNRQRNRLLWRPTHIVLHWSLTIILFSVISRTLVGGVLPLCRGAVSIFCNHSRLGYNILVGIIFINCFSRHGWFSAIAFTYLL